MASIYEHPLYYDILFDWDRSDEADFYSRAFLAAGVQQDEAVLEVACGTGLIARRLAASGWRATGLDLSADMLAFLNAQADGAVDTLLADMTAFETPDVFGAAFNPMSSFRMLDLDEDAVAHLTCMARCLRPGGLYLLDLSLAATPDEAEVTTDEDWTMRRGDVAVSATNAGITVRDGTVSLALDWDQDGHLRSLTPHNLTQLIAATNAFELVAWHPEYARTGDDGASAFSLDVSHCEPQPGRGMAVLKRI